VSVPGNNLLRQALRLIRPQTVAYFRAVGRTTAPGGRDVTQFAPAETLANVSVQAVPLSRYEMLGLDFQKVYVSLFAPASVTGIARDRAGDEFLWNNQRYAVVMETSWFAQDGWTNTVGVLIGLGSSSSVET